MAEKLLNEHLYGNLLAPEGGYVTDFAVGMTYSLGFDALLTAHLAFGLLDDVSDDALNTPHLLLEAIAQSRNKVVVFCNKGCIAVPTNIQKAHSLLESNIYEVFDRQNVHANFHPKLWLIREINKESSRDVQIKVIVTSRNLKFSQHLDCIVCMKGKVGKGRTQNPKNQALAEFIMNVAENANVTNQSKKSIKKLTEDLLKVETFDVSAPFEDYDFFPYFFQSRDGKHEYPVELKGTHTVIVSPFLEKKTLEHLCPKTSATLVTRREYVDQEIFEMFKGNVYVCNDELASSGMDLHAKMYHVWSGLDRQYLFLGSANATYSAFNRNAEILLRLKYKRSHRADFLAEFYCETDTDSRFIKMTELDLCEQETSSTTDDTEKNMKELMCSEKLMAKITRHHNGRYSIIVTSESSNDNIFLAPLQKPQTTRAWAKKMQFDQLEASELSEFYIISANAPDGKHIQKIIKIQTEGMPEERDRAIYKSIIKSKNDFFSLIELMLTDNPLSYFAGHKAGIVRKPVTGEPNEKIFYSSLYESLLKAAATEPEKIKKIQEITCRLDKDLVPDEFQKLIRQFAAAIK